MVVKLKSPDAWFIQVDVQFATEYGLNEAIIAAKLLRLLNKLTGAIDEAGNKWVRFTLEEWAKELPFMSGMTIRRTLESLEKKTIMLTRTFAGRSKWYRLNPDFIDDNAIVQNEQLPPENGPSVQNEQLVSVQNEQINCSNCTDTSVQNEQLPRVLPRVSPIDKSEKTDLDSSEIWTQAQPILSGAMTRATYEQVIKYCEPRPGHNGAFVLAAPAGVCELVEHRLKNTILQALNQINPVSELEVIEL